MSPGHLSATLPAGCQLSAHVTSPVTPVTACLYAPLQCAQLEARPVSAVCDRVLCLLVQ
jgi:hypothetical protein